MFPRENWKRYDPQEIGRNDMDTMERVWDLAATEGGGDWTVGTLVGRKNRSFYILDVRRFRKGAGGVQDEVKRIATIDGYSVPIKIEEERSGAGKSVIASYEKLLIGHVIGPAKAEGSKESRAMPYSAEQQKGNVYLPFASSVDWDVKAFIDEHAKMMGDGRRPRHDDQIDTAAYAMLDLIGLEGADAFVASEDLGAEALQALDRSGFSEGLDGVLAEILGW